MVPRGLGPVFAKFYKWRLAAFQLCQLWTTTDHKSHLWNHTDGCLMRLNEADDDVVSWLKYMAALTLAK